MRGRWIGRGVSAGIVLLTALAAAAITSGELDPTPGAGVVLVTGATPATGTITLHNGSASAIQLATINRVGCGAAPTGALVGSGTTIGPGSSRQFTVSCPGHTGSNGPFGMERCLFEGSDSSGTPVGRWMGVCESSQTAALANDTTSNLIDFGSVTMGVPATRTFNLTNNGSAAITKLSFQLDDIAGDFLVGSPCNPDAAYCDGAVPAIAPGGSATITVACSPQNTGALSAKLYIDSDQHTYMATPITLTCTGTATTAPVIDIFPAKIDVGPVEVISALGSAVVHIANTGSGALQITDVQIDSVDPDAALDWHYTASGACGGMIPPATCSLAHGDQVDLELTFDPSALFSRRATLSISYADTAPKTATVQLDGIGQGATIDVYDTPSTLDFGVVPVMGTSTLTVQLANHGNRDTTAMLAVTPMTGPFSLAPMASAVVSPPPGTPTTITAKCAPTTAGMFAATITAMGSDTVSGAPVSIDARCEGSTLPLYASPSAISLGEIRTGTTPMPTKIMLLAAPATTTVTLDGDPHLEDTNPNLSVGSAASSMTPTSFELSVDPQQQGALDSHIAVTDTDGNTLRIPVTGTVVTASYVAPPMLDLGTFCINLPTASSNVSLTSTGTATIGLAPPTLASGTASPFELAFANPGAYPAPLVPEGIATVSVTPARQGSAGTEQDSVTWHTDVAGLETATTDITASFIASGGAIAPGALQFGKVPIHLLTANGQRVMIQNCSAAVLQLDTPVIAAPFSIDSPIPMTLNPSETATFSVGFHPTRVGAVSSILRITSPQLQTPLTVSLAGEGVTIGSGDDGGGSGSSTGHGPTSFYACSDCSTGGSGGAVSLIVLCVLLRRRR